MAGQSLRRPARLDARASQFLAVQMTSNTTEHHQILPFRRIVTALILTGILVACWMIVDVRFSVLFDRTAAAAVWEFIRGLFPPDLTAKFLGVVAIAAAQTIAMALCGTALSIALALPLGAVAAPVLWQRGVLLAGEKRGARTFLLKAISRTTSAFLGFIRAVPDLMWGLFFVVMVGLGPLAGTLALAVSYAGMLGRVYADIFDDVDVGALEALHATGAKRFQVFVRGVLPQAMPSLTAYTLYSLECCVRAASVLGFIGAGGIGYEISISMRLFEYGQVLTLLLTLITLIALTDYLSRWVRRSLYSNSPSSLFPHRLIDKETALGRSFDILRERRRLLLTIALLSVLLWSFYALGFFSGSITDSKIPSRVWRFVGGIIPPDLSLSYLTSLGVPLVQTIGISVIGTVLGIGIGIVLGLPATATVILAEPEVAGYRSGLNRVGRWFLYLTARLFLNGLRSIPELLWVLIFIQIVGLGPFAGALAIGVHTGGVLGKLYAESLEEVPARPVEALRSSGAGPLQVLVCGILPQAMPMLLSFSILRWEMNLRVSTILGMVGGGGLGQAIYNNIQLGFYPKVGTLIAITYGLVLATDWINRRLRR